MGKRLFCEFCCDVIFHKGDDGVWNTCPFERISIAIGGFTPQLNKLPS